jgi:periplasmic divalent cation tolerance protein
MSAASVYAVFASGEEAERIGRIVVEERLAACINILAPCRSIYHWKGAVESGEEVPALFKTRADRAEALIERIAELHSYDIPAAVAWPIISGHPPYLDWIISEVS